MKAYKRRECSNSTGGLKRLDTQKVFHQFSPSSLSQCAAVVWTRSSVDVSASACIAS